MIKYDGMPTESEEPIVHKEINNLEMIGYIMEQTQDRNLTYKDVQAILQAETNFLIENGFIDQPES